MVMETVEKLNRRLDEVQGQQRMLDLYFAGAQPLAFLSAEARDALKGFSALPVNLCRVTVEALAERLRVVGFEAADDATANWLWAAFENAGMGEGQHMAHVEALAARRCYVTVWSLEDAPSLSVESAASMTVETHPVTGAVTAALKRWVADGSAHAVLWLPSSVHRLRSTVNVAEFSAIPPTAWRTVEALANPLGRVPVVPFVNRGRLGDVLGVSEMEPVMPLVDSLSKLAADMMVSSEYFARPRRWATGIEVEEDEEGNPIDPFVEGPKRILQAENEAARFGAFPTAELGAYEAATRVILGHVAAVSSLPPHYLGVHGDQPPSADALRSAEAGLVGKVLARQRTFSPAWSQVADLMLQVGGRPRGRVQAMWANAETRTPAQEADAKAKLVTAGILPIEQAQLDLGYSPEQVSRWRRERLVTGFITGGEQE